MTTLYAWCHIICCCSFKNVTLHLQCHYIYCPTRLLLEKCAIHVFVLDPIIARNIEYMSLEMWIWLLIHDILICLRNDWIWINEHWTLFSLHSNTMTSCTSSPAENVLCNIAPFFYHHSVGIQHLVSDTLYQTGYFH